MAEWSLRKPNLTSKKAKMDGLCGGKQMIPPIKTINMVTPPLFGHAWPELSAGDIVPRRCWRSTNQLCSLEPYPSPSPPFDRCLGKEGIDSSYLFSRAFLRRSNCALALCFATYVDLFACVLTSKLHRAVLFFLWWQHLRFFVLAFDPLSAW